MWGIGHRLESTSNNGVGVAKRNGLSSKNDRLEAWWADFVDSCAWHVGS